MLHRQHFYSTYCTFIAARLNSTEVTEDHHEAREGKQDSSAECLGRVSAGSARTAAAGNFGIKPLVRWAPSAISRAVIVTQTHFGPGDDSHRHRAATCAAVRLPQLLRGRDAAVLPPAAALLPPPPPPPGRASALRAAAGAAPRGATAAEEQGPTPPPGRAAGPAPPRSPQPAARGGGPGGGGCGVEGLRPPRWRREGATQLPPGPDTRLPAARGPAAPAAGRSVAGLGAPSPACPPRRAYRACLRRAASRSRASSSRKVSSAGSYTSRKGPCGPTCSYRGVGSGGGAAIASRGAHARARPPRAAAPRQRVGATLWRRERKAGACGVGGGGGGAGERRGTRATDTANGSAPAWPRPERGSNGCWPRLRAVAASAASMLAKFRR